MKIQRLFILYFVFSVKVYGQELEARAYANLPKAMNVVAAVYAFSKGQVLADASLPIQDFNMTTHSLNLAYVHSFALAGKLARVQIAVPFIHMNGQLKYSAQDTSGTRTGLGDVRVRLGINLIGAPALAAKDFRKYTEKTIVGISLVTSVPTGIYYADKLINIGHHRWGFKPEIGASRRFKHIYTDGYIGMWFYTNNNAYLKNSILKQHSLFSTQLHASYYFKKGMMIGVDGNWFNGGRTFVDEVQSGEEIEHIRLGVTWALPITKKHMVKLQYHASVYTNTGYNYDLVAVGYQYIFF
jgi:hypothetical protein